MSKKAQHQSNLEKHHVRDTRYLLKKGLEYKDQLELMVKRHTVDRQPIDESAANKLSRLSRAYFQLLLEERGTTLTAAEAQAVRQHIEQVDFLSLEMISSLDINETNLERQKVYDMKIPSKQNIPRQNSRNLTE